MKKGFGNDFNKKNSNLDKNVLVEDIELSAQTKKAIFLAREGKFLESAKIYNDLILKGKSNHLTFHRLAGIYERLGKRKEAFQCLQKAISVKKNYAEAYCDIGRYLLDDKDSKSAFTIDYQKEVILERISIYFGFQVVSKLKIKSSL